MGGFNHLQPDDPAFDAGVSVPGYQTKRGKPVPPVRRATWSARGGMGQQHDADLGAKVLDEALGD